MTKQAYLFDLSEFLIKYISDWEDIFEVSINTHRNLNLILYKSIDFFLKRAWCDILNDTPHSSSKCRLLLKC